MKRKPGDLEPSLNLHMPGVVYTRTTKWGEVTQAWPRKRPPPMDQRSVIRRKNFGLAAIMAANPMDLDYYFAQARARGTTMVPRDILTLAALGQLFELHGPWPIQWKYLPIDAPPPPPPPPIGGETMWEWSLWDAAWNSVMNTTAFATKGTWFISRTNAVVTGVRFIWNHVAAGEYRLAVYELDATAHITAIVISGDYEATTNGLNVGEITGTGEIEAGRRYAIALSRTDVPDDHALPISQNQVQHFLFPMTYLGGLRLAKAQPEIGDQFIQPTASTVPCAIRV